MGESRDERNILDAFRAAAPPEWFENAAPDEFGDLALHMPSPSPCDERGLRLTVDVDYDEVLVIFGGGHSHGGDWREPGAPDEGFRTTLQLVREILEEKVVGYRLPDGGGGLARLDELSDLPADATIRSWKGTLDRGS